MAGIGFELRKIYNEDSLFSKQKAYAYAGIVYTGPMLLGILLTAGVVVLTMVAGIRPAPKKGKAIGKIK